MTENPPLRDLRFASLFTGIGGLDAGLEMGLEEEGISVQHTALCEHFASPKPHRDDDYPRRVLAKRFLGVPILGDVATIDAAELGAHDILVGGFPCFPAGTLIDTHDGLKPIESVIVGELVYTHQRRWRPVTKTMSKPRAPLIEIKAMGGLPLRATPEHPFYARLRDEPAEWVEAQDLTAEHFLAQPMAREAEPVDGATEAFWRLVGRYLGDGWIVNHKRKGRKTSLVWKVLICCAPAEEQELQETIEAAGFRATIAKEKNLLKFHICSKSLVEFLQPFGKYADGKCLPGWVLRLPVDDLRALWEGYFEADGNVHSKTLRMATVSKPLALGMAQVARIVHELPVSIHVSERAPTTVIEGRVVNQQRSISTVISTTPSKIAFVADGFAWVPVRSVSDILDRSEVFNLSVDEDESYVADSFVVHNCTDISAAKSDPQGLAGARSGLWFQMLRLIREGEPPFVVIENVSALRSRGLWAVLAGLWESGYAAQYDIISARSVGAPHLRERCFILATRLDIYQGPLDFVGAMPTECAWQGWWPLPWREGEKPKTDKPRIKACGNAVVPQVAAVIGRALGRGALAPMTPGKRLYPLHPDTKLPRAGYIDLDSGEVCPLPPAAPPNKHACTYLLPTPTATSYRTNSGGERPGHKRPSLEVLAREGRIPTPVASEGTDKGSGFRDGGAWRSLGRVVKDDFIHYRETLNADSSVDFWYGPPESGQPPDGRLVTRPQTRADHESRLVESGLVRAMEEGKVPTPQTRDWKGPVGRGSQARGGHKSSLPTVVHDDFHTALRAAREAELLHHMEESTVPTPTSSAVKGGGTGGEWHRTLHQGLGGSLNPEFVEWLMGLPLSWTDVDVD